MVSFIDFYFHFLASYVLFIFSCDTRSEPGLPVHTFRVFKDVRANCFCASLLRTQIRMPRHT